MLKAILLSGGSHPQAPVDRQMKMVEIIRKHEVEIIAIIADTMRQNYETTARSIAQSFPNNPPVFCSRYPHKDSQIMNVLKENIIPLGINVGFNSILRAEFLNQFSMGVISIHPAALPYNRGCHHSFWGIMERTLHGATLYWMDPGIDSGDITDQIVFEDDGVMSAEEIQVRANSLYTDLLESNLASIINGTAPRTPQEGGSYHSINEIKSATTLDANDSISVERLLRLSRATNCREHGFYIKKDDKTYIVRASVKLVE